MVCRVFYIPTLCWLCRPSYPALISRFTCQVVSAWPGQVRRAYESAPTFLTMLGLESGRLTALFVCFKDDSMPFTKWLGCRSRARRLNWRWQHTISCVLGSILRGRKLKQRSSAAHSRCGLGTSRAGSGEASSPCAEDAGLQRAGDAQPEDVAFGKQGASRGLWKATSKLRLIAEPVTFTRVMQCSVCLFVCMFVKMTGQEELMWAHGAGLHR